VWLGALGEVGIIKCGNWKVPEEMSVGHETEEVVVLEGAGLELLVAVALVLVLDPRAAQENPPLWN